jgi:hypothetical protein
VQGVPTGCQFDSPRERILRAALSCWLAPKVVAASLLI